MGRASYSGSIRYPRVLVTFGGGVEYSLKRDEAEDLRDSIHKAISDLDLGVHDEYRRFLASVPKDPSTGKLKPATREQWRRLLDEAGLEDVQEPE